MIKSDNSMKFAKRKPKCGVHPDFGLNVSLVDIRLTIQDCVSALPMNGSEYFSEVSVKR